MSEHKTAIADTIRARLADGRSIAESDVRALLAERDAAVASEAAAIRQARARIDQCDKLLAERDAAVKAWKEYAAAHHDAARGFAEECTAHRATMAERDAAQAEAKRLREALEKAAEWFEGYAEGHKSAGALDKAARNLERANACRRAALSRHANPEEQT
jgi:hypothetical protein